MALKIVYLLDNNQLVRAREAWRISQDPVVRAKTSCDIPSWVSPGVYGLTLEGNKLIYEGDESGLTVLTPGGRWSLLWYILLKPPAMNSSIVNYEINGGVGGVWYDRIEWVLETLTDEDLFDRHMANRSPAYLGWIADEHAPNGGRYESPSPLFLKIMTEFTNRHPRLMRDIETKNPSWVTNNYTPATVTLSRMLKAPYEALLNKTL